MKNLLKCNEEDMWKMLKLRGINVVDEKFKTTKFKTNEFSDKMISPYEENI